MDFILKIYEYRFIIGLVLGIAIIAYLLYLFVCDILIKGCTEINDKVTYRVGITNYETEFGAKKRCEYLYKKHNVNANTLN